MKNGIPFDVAFSAPAHLVLAYTIIFGESEGVSSFDWDDMMWRKRSG